jgi:hypothetical protein
LDDDDDTTLTAPKSKYAASFRTGHESQWGSDYKDDQSAVHGGGPDYPPMPAYDPNAYPPQPGYAAGFGSSHGHDTGYDDVSIFTPQMILLLTNPTQQQASKPGYGNDQYNYGANNYGQTGHGQYQDAYGYGAYDQQGYGNDAAYATTPTYQDPSQYQQRAPSRNMLSRNEQRQWDNGGQGNGAGGHYTGSHAL